jgi:hypothetical protein
MSDAWSAFRTFGQATHRQQPADTEPGLGFDDVGHSWIRFPGEHSPKARHPFAVIRKALGLRGRRAFSQRKRIPPCRAPTSSFMPQKAPALHHPPAEPQSPGRLPGSPKAQRAFGTQRRVGAQRLPWKSPKNHRPRMPNPNGVPNLWSGRVRLGSTSNPFLQPG